MTTSHLATALHGWYRPEDCRLDDFRAVVERTTDPADYPCADSVEQGVLVYGSRLRDRAAAPEHRREVQAELRNVVAASAEGYAFPTDLDRDQPVGGLAPQTQTELVRLALGEGWDTAAFTAALRAHTERRGTGRG